MKHILVTGASGAVGRETLSALSAMSGVSVTAFDRPTAQAKRILKDHQEHCTVVWGDITDADAVRQAMTGIDAVIHLAAIIPPLAEKYPELAERVNIGGTRNIIHAAENGRDPLIIFASSVSVYGDRLANPWIRVGDPMKPGNDAYARTKIQCEAELARSGRRYTIFRLNAVMYPTISMNSAMFHMPLATEFEIVTSCDAGYAFAHAVEHPELIGRIFNLGGGPACRTTYREYINNCFDVMGLGRDFLPESAFASGGFHCGNYADSADLNEILRFQRASLATHLNDMRAVLPGWKRTLAGFVKGVIRRKILKYAEFA